jgi:hypothetical protein
MGVKEWIQRLKEESIQGMPPGAAIEERFVLPMEYYRNEGDIERWKLQMLFQEERIARGSQAVMDQWGGINEHFPMHTNYPTSCVYCEYEEVCHGPESYLHNPMSLGIYRPREANHKAEGREWD